VKITKKKLETLILEELQKVSGAPLLKENRRGKKKKINPTKLRIRKAKQSTARAERKAIKNASRYMKVMRGMKSYIEKMPNGAKIYFVLTSGQTAKGGYLALNKKAQELGYSDGQVWEAFIGDKDKYKPAHMFAMIKALFVWASTSGVLSMIPGYDETMTLRDLTINMEKEPFGGRGGR
jgi:hypothetical protein